MKEDKRLMIFNIQRYSLHDGAGIRTVVFLKGCPLRCLWCCNPESQSFDRELIYRKARCIGMEHCGLCRKADLREEIGTKKHFLGVRTGSDGKALPDMDRCRGAFGLAKICPAKAFEVEGREISIEEIMDIVRHDEVFYRGKGGLTLSGGEPLAQEGSIELLKRAKEEYVHTAVESCGSVPEDRLLRAAEYLDEIFFDVKSVNSEQHIRYTGVSNEQILSNLKSLKKAFPTKKIHVRTPVIPGFNDSEEELSAIEAYLGSLGITDWEKLPYHTYGVGKYEMQGREYLLPRKD
jgi:pyruvate formate lyase activating enzyme